ncbi:stearic acid desaturase [Penicillium argentinense]|uniref:Acyl-CoA desaturase n=1 Tax=Penicillium argentinense TaxID=1131581 RepID=A0A9W9K2S8_9EURO|nr:stearic acid desaturase [Penicillium argentinense]KAJ5091019.1 stearic acid desaturase [Penicillium argentinense]
MEQAAMDKPRPGEGQKTHITHLPITLTNWYKHLNWPGIGLTILVPLHGFLLAPHTPLQWRTAIWSVMYYFWTGFGITADIYTHTLAIDEGYHRLWSHSSYRATKLLKVLLALIGGGAGEGSILWWARDHRAHHRFTDTTGDPYSVHKGLLYAHMGWLIMKQDPKRIGRTDISDLKADAVVMWQHRNYVAIVVTMAFLFPTLVSGVGWGDWKGGFVYAGILRMLFVHQATFCVNSLAHWLGEQPFDDRRSPRDHFLTALLALGEGYHNFHHGFPSDYRNATEWWQYDPTKWVIWAWARLGLAYDLKRFPAKEVQKCRLQQRKVRLDKQMADFNWGPPLEDLPVIGWKQFFEQASTMGRSWTVVSGIVHDVSGFIDEHPGGRAMIKGGIGKDASAMFQGGVYLHSRYAHQKLAQMRVAVIHDPSASELAESQD